MILHINPLESFLFRTNKPFGVSDNTAQSVFPPAPTTLYGAVRTAVIMHNNCLSEFLAHKTEDKLAFELRKQLGTTEECGEFRIKKYGLMDMDGKYLFPAPRDCMGKAKTELKKSEVKILPKWDYPEKIIVKDADTPVFRTDKGYSYKENSWINNLKDYLLAEYNNLHLISQSEFLIEEGHTGIQISADNGIVAEGMLFTQQRLRMKDEYSLFIEYTGLDNLEKISTLSIGQDKKTFKISQTDNIIFDDFNDKLKQKIKENNGSFKIYLSSPTYFINGTTPHNFNSETKIWKISNDLEIMINNIIGAKPVIIGGWDLAKRCPKKILKFHNYGTVFYCKLNELDKLDLLFECINQKNICDDENLNKQGYGHAFIGVL